MTEEEMTLKEKLEHDLYRISGYYDEYGNTDYVKESILDMYEYFNNVIKELDKKMKKLQHKVR